MAKNAKTKAKTVDPDLDAAAKRYARRHIRFGWWSLLVFLTVGLVLEALHGFKVGAYLDIPHETRRLMWTLGHAHGTLLALVNLAFGATLSYFSGSPRVASGWLLGASVLMPAGFLLGGAVTYGGDPGLGIVLVALGGLMLLVAVFLIARATGASVGNRKSPGRE